MIVFIVIISGDCLRIVKVNPVLRIIFYKRPSSGFFASLGMSQVFPILIAPSIRPALQ